MSSHHFVKEKQEPALLIESLTFFDRYYLDQLLEWNPLVLCSTTSYFELENRQIKADVLFSNFEKIQTSQNDVNEEIYQHSFIDTALTYIIHHQYHAVNIILEGSLPIQRLLPYASVLNLIVYHDKRRSFTVRSGFRKWKPAHSIIQIQDLTSLKVDGLENIGNGNYITKQDGFYRVEFEQAYIFISEEI